MTFIISDPPQTEPPVLWNALWGPKEIMRVQFTEDGKVRVILHPHSEEVVSDHDPESYFESQRLMERLWRERLAERENA